MSVKHSKGTGPGGPSLVRGKNITYTDQLSQDERIELADVFERIANPRTGSISYADLLEAVTYAIGKTSSHLGLLQRSQCEGHHPSYEQQWEPEDPLD